MAKPRHTRSVYRYAGKHAPFARFCLCVLAMALVTCGLNARRIFDLVTGAAGAVATAVADSAVADSAAEEAAEAAAAEKLAASVEDLKVYRIDLAQAVAKINQLTPGELFSLVLAIVLCLCLAVFLLSLWYVRVRVAVFFSQCTFIEGTEEYREFVLAEATHVMVTEAATAADAGEDRKAAAHEIIELKRSRFYTYYLHGHRKYILDQRDAAFQPVDHIDSVDLTVLGDWRGLSTKFEGNTRPFGLERSVPVCADWFGDNDYAIPACNFKAMLLDSFLSPFFLFQLFATLLWVMDNYWYYSLLSVFSIITIEVQMVNKRIREYDRINAMRIPPANVHVYRDAKWGTMLSNKLYPGDLFLLSLDGSNAPSVAPADCLVLSGDVVVDESILTGESVPQFKSALDLETLRKKRATITSTDSEMRQSTVFAGTAVMLCRGDSGAFAGIKLPRQGCVCMVLRTGFESYQGRLVEAIMHSGDRVTASTTEGWCFLGILLSFALVSCSFVLRRLPTASLKKLVLTTLHIITSVIPPEFPVILSMAVTIAILQLHKKGIFCTEPFRVPYAGQLDVCAFDKTGTLTEDQMKVVGVVAGNSLSSASPGPNTEATELQSMPLPIAAALVVGGCHSLSRVGGSVVGDPMEKAAFEHFGWSLSGDSKCAESLQPWFYNASGKLASAKVTVVRRWQFMSELGRMSSIVTVGGAATYWRRSFAEGDGADPVKSRSSRMGGGSASQAAQTESPYLSLDTSLDGKTLLLCKGAPERVRPLLREPPEYYDALYQRLAIGGMRVLALACRRLTLNAKQLPAAERADVETALDFVGFLALESPIKPSSVQCMRQLDGHKIVMITGDNVLTACHVAHAAEMGDRSEPVSTPALRRSWGEFAILVPSDDTFVWRSRTGEALQPLGAGADFVEVMHALRNGSMRLCVTGPAMDALLDYERANDRKVVAEVVLSATVFARVSPQQKEFVVRTFKRAGKKTAMCGDGTNDMAALKAAHVGISLLKSAVQKAPTQLNAKLSGMIRKQSNERHRETLEQLQRELQDDVPEIKLGEASIASPFTYRRNDVLCVPLLVRNGRCTLTNVVLLYKVMGINSLITSLGMSVLAMDGVNFSDAQTTMYSLMYTFMLMALSKSKPAQVSSSKRPEGSVFSPANFVSLVLQCALHIGLVLHLWALGKAERSPAYVPDLDAPFEPNLVNTLLYYACFVVNLAGFLANYQGYPYMQPLRDNRFVCRPLLAALLLVVVLVCDLCAPVSAYLSLVSIPHNALRLQVLGALGADLAVSLAVEHMCRRWLAR